MDYRAIASANGARVRRERQFFQTNTDPEDLADDMLFEHERRPQGWAKCPCGGNVYFHEHTCAWKCEGCGEIYISRDIESISTEKVVWP